MAKDSKERENCLKKAEALKNKFNKKHGDLLPIFTRIYNLFKDQFNQSKKQREKIKSLEKQIESQKSSFRKLEEDMKEIYSSTGAVKLLLNKRDIKEEVIKTIRKAEEELYVSGYKIDPEIETLTELFNKIRESSPKRVVIRYERGVGTKYSTAKKRIEGKIRTPEIEKIDCKSPSSLSYHRRGIFNEDRGIVMTCSWEKLFGGGRDLIIGVIINNSKEIRKFKKNLM